MLKCLNCGHLFKSNIATKATRCSACGKASFLQVDKINEAVVADIQILKKQIIIISDRLAALEGQKSESMHPADAGAAPLPEPAERPDQADTAQPVEPDQDRPVTQLEKMKAKFGE